MFVPQARGVLKSKTKPYASSCSTSSTRLEKHEVYPDGSYCVIVAINTYESSNISIHKGGMTNLLCARNDGELMKSILIDHHQFEIIGELYDAKATSMDFLDLLDDGGWLIACLLSRFWSSLTKRNVLFSFSPFLLFSFSLLVFSQTVFETEKTIQIYLFSRQSRAFGRRWSRMDMHTWLQFKQIEQYLY
jgi:hypothetical protein